MLLPCFSLASKKGASVMVKLDDSSSFFLLPHQALSGSDIPSVPVYHLGKVPTRESHESGGELVSIFMRMPGAGHALRIFRMCFVLCLNTTVMRHEFMPHNQATNHKLKQNQ